MMGSSLEKKVSRRELLRGMGVMGAAVLLGCDTTTGRPGNGGNDESEVDRSYLQEFLEVVDRIVDEGLVSDDLVGRYLEYFSDPGPMTVKALELSYDAWKEDRVFHPELAFFEPDFLGIAPLNHILPSSSMPGILADPEHNGGLEPLVNYPINEDTTQYLGLNWGDVDGKPSPFLRKFAGYDECVVAPPDSIHQSSIKMSLRQYFDPDAEFGSRYRPWHPVFNGSLIPARVRNILVREYEYMGFTVSDCTLSVEHDVPDRDRRLLDLPFLRIVYAHLQPEEGMMRYDKHDFPVREGEMVSFGESLGGVNQHHGPAFLLDHSYQSSSGFGVPDVHFPEITTIDVLGGKYAPEGLRLLPTQPRYLDNRIYRPCASRGGWDWVPYPDEP